MDGRINGMQIKKVLTAVSLELEKNNIPYALIGALAFAYWGHRRYTEDIDFLVQRADVQKVKAIMGKYGYEIYVDTNNATQFTHMIKEMVDIDFLYANKEASLGMIKQARGFEAIDGVEIKVALPEDLIALKLQAIGLNPKRELQDMADIQAIVELLGDKLNWNIINEYCKLLDMETFYERICKFT